MGAPLKVNYEGDTTKDPIGFTKYLLHENNIKDFARALEAIFMYWRDLLYKPA